MARPRKLSGKLSPPPETDGELRVAKHKRVFDHLLNSIQAGELKPGDRLPSEAELGKMFDASRITVAKAVHDLQRMGLVTRRPGAGTHVQQPSQTAGRTFGLLIPELGVTEIFEPICHGMMRTKFARPDALLWGNAGTATREMAKEAEQLVQFFIAQKVAGVFFAPIELVPEKDVVNRKLARSLERAQIPMVLLDRCYMPYPERSAHDVVGIDNRRAGHVVTAHLVAHGAQRPVFLGEEYSASTVDARITGFREALRAFERVTPENAVWRGSPQDEVFVRQMLDESKADAVVCANDLTAARLMQTLIGMGVKIPEEARITGFDDIKYASLLPVPLTTIHQDTAGLGATAIAAMLERLEHPELPARDLLVPFKLVVRRSCGSHLSSETVPESK